MSDWLNHLLFLILDVERRCIRLASSIANLTAVCKTLNDYPQAIRLSSSAVSVRRQKNSHMALPACIRISIGELIQVIGLGCLLAALNPLAA
jgi:hypothetical protein